MAYADYEYYTGSYLLGKECIIPNSEFRYWEKQARTEVDKYTFDRLKDHRLVTDKVRDCVCELAELLYQGNVLKQSAYANGGGGLLASFSNDGESGSYDLAQSDYTADGISKKTRGIIYGYLGNTGLLYAGARVKS